MRGQRDYAVVGAYHGLEEGEVVATTLRAGGIDAFVGNAHHATNDWLYLRAMGGAQVFVPSWRLDEARSLLLDQITGAEAVAETEVHLIRRDRWKFWIAIFFMYPPLALLGCVALLALAWERVFAETDAEAHS